MSCTNLKTSVSGKTKTLSDLINCYKSSLDKASTDNRTLYGDLNEVANMKDSVKSENFLKRCVCHRNCHQQRLKDDDVDAAVEKLLNNPTIWKQRPKDFEELYDCIYNLIGKGKTGISYCTVYDTAIRIGHTLSPAIEPKEFVYVHRKLIQSAKHILNKNYVLIANCRIERESFDKADSAFTQLTSLEIEDFLCVCHDRI